MGVITRQFVCVFAAICVGSVVVVDTLMRFGPDWLLYTLLAIGGACVTAMVVAAFVWESQDKRAAKQRRKERDERVSAGTMDASDLYQLVWQAWSPKKRHWDETNGVVPYSDGRAVRYCAFDSADRHYADPDISSTPYDPNVVARWVKSKQDPALLVAAVRAGVSSDDLTAYLNDEPGFRDTFGFMLSLATPPVETRH
jgi:hypothetical protein